MSNDTEKQAQTLSALIQLQDVTKETSFDFDRYLKKPVPRLKLIWFVLSVVSFTSVLGLLLLTTFSILSFMFGVACVGWVVFCVYHRWESTGGAIVVFITAAVLLLLASGLITPKETAEQVKNYIQR